MLVSGGSTAPAPTGYGSGAYGDGRYGGGVDYPPGTYGYGAYGSGTYGGVTVPDPGGGSGGGTGGGVALPPPHNTPAPVKPTIAQLAGTNWIRY